MPRVLVRREAGLFAYEQTLARAGLSPVAGADEAGRGACAGPLVVAAVILRKEIAGLGDSKALTAKRRDQLFDVITELAEVSVVTIPAEEIDQRGLHKSNIEGMRRALTGLPTVPAYVLTDGFPVAGVGTPGLAVWKGDQVSASIAAASIIAKVTRDRMMEELDSLYPEYGFAIHKGYVTSQHQRALREWGASPVHRFSFANVGEV